MDEWKQFDAYDLIPKRSWPRVLKKRFFEINPHGEIRYLSTLTNPTSYKYVKPAILNHEKYFIAIVGGSHGNQVVIRIPIKNLVSRYFNL
jgi:hypothetical protein